jgi:tetratricopeptide (TPR) repeat protein
MGDSDSEEPRRYAAFISYSHRDRKWAEWLHRAIENYRIPKGLLAPSAAESKQKNSLGTVFLDRAELPTSSDLAATVLAALEQSAFLIVVCSPDAANSRWVNEEIRIFKSLGREDCILCLIVAGEPSVSDCFPAALRFKVEGGEITAVLAPEPLAADVRPHKDDRQVARLKIVAGLLGVPFDRLRQRELVRRQRRLAVIAATSALACVVFGVLAAAALFASKEANRQRVLAEQQSLTARRTAEFLKSLFVVSDPSEALGNSITAREVLDRGVRQVDEELKEEPLVRADLSTTLGEVYASLGLLKEGEGLLARARAVPMQSDEMAARQSAALGDVQFQRGEYDAALASLQQASRSLDQSANRDSTLRGRILLSEGDVYARKDNYEQSRRSYREALALAAGSSSADREVVAQALQGIAEADFYDGRLDQAALGLQKALAARLALSGELHPSSIELLNQWGTVEYMRGHLAAAGEYFQRTLVLEQRVLGDRHPHLADTRNNLGRVLLEQRKFDQARQMLQKSLDNRSSQIVETQGGWAFVYGNLALADAQLGDYSTAEPLFHKGLQAAIINKHRLHGPILTDIADLECRTGRVNDGLTRLDEARPIVAARYPDDPWRVAYVDNVRAGCLTQVKRYAEAERLIESSDPVILKKWPSGTLYGHDALQRSVSLYSLTGNAAKLAEYRKLAEKK